MIRFGAFGDRVLLTPLLHLLHRRYGHPCRVLGSGAWLEPLFAGHPDVARVQCIASRRQSYWLDVTQRRLVALLRAESPGPAYVYDDYTATKLRWLLDRAGVPEDACVFANPDCLLRPGDHGIDRWWRFGTLTPSASIGVPVARAEDLLAAPRLFANEADRRDLEVWLARYALGAAPLVLLQPGDKRTMKRGRAGALNDDTQWPIANWTALIRYLLSSGRATTSCCAACHERRRSFRRSP